MTIENAFFTKRFYLDSVVNRNMNKSSDHFLGTEFRSFWVSKTNNSKFEATLALNPRTDTSSGGLPLRLNQCQYLTTKKAEDCCIEVPFAQPGVWIDVCFSQEERIDVGGVAIDLTGEVVITEGSGHSSAKKIVPAGNVTSIISVNPNRTVSTIQVKSGGDFYIGNPLELADADFKNICILVSLIPGQVFTWKNKGSLSARTDSALVGLVLAVLDEVK